MIGRPLIQADKLRLVLKRFCLTLKGPEGALRGLKGIRVPSSKLKLRVRSKAPFWFFDGIKIFKLCLLPLIYIISVRKQSYADNEHYLRKSASVQIIAHEPSRCEGCFDGRLPLLMVVIFIASVIFLLCVGVVVDFQSKYWIFVFLQIKINKWTIFMDLMRP